MLGNRDAACDGISKSPIWGVAVWGSLDPSIDVDAPIGLPAGPYAAHARALQLELLSFKKHLSHIAFSFLAC